MFKSKQNRKSNRKLDIKTISNVNSFLTVPD